MLVSIYMFIKTNGDMILAGQALAWAVVEFIVRITPTKKDDAALERIGKALRKGMDALGVPNRKVIVVPASQAPATEEKPAA